MKIFKIAFLLFIYLVLSTSAYAANHYIRAGATGSNNGSDWENAWTNMPVSYTRGDTYYVADGTYTGERTLNTAESGSTYIYIKKATASEHGTETGWNSGYGDGTAVFTYNGGRQSLRCAWCVHDQHRILGHRRGHGWRPHELGRAVRFRDRQHHIPERDLDL
jgi:hypothetical protein